MWITVGKCHLQTAWCPLEAGICPLWAALCHLQAALCHLSPFLISLEALSRKGLREGIQRLQKVLQRVYKRFYKLSYKEALRKIAPAALLLRDFPSFEESIRLATCSPFTRGRNMSPFIALGAPVDERRARSEELRLC